MSYVDVPNRPQRAQVMARARKAQPAPASFNQRDAFKTVGMFQELREAWVREQSTHPLFEALKEAWGGRRS